MDTVIIGIDPGETTGIARLRLHKVAAVFISSTEFGQYPPNLVVASLVSVREWAPEPPARLVIAMERFIVGPRASRSSTPKAGATTRDLITLITSWANLNDATVLEHSAADVKPWATDKRLEAAGLLEPTKGIRHARDGARHALFTAVQTYNLPDPLSRRAGAR